MTRCGEKHSIKREGPWFFATMVLVFQWDSFCPHRCLLPCFPAWHQWLDQRTLKCRAEGASLAPEGEMKQDVTKAGGPQLIQPQWPPRLPPREQKQTGFIFSPLVGP